jgi:hypothetical protein
VHRIERVEDADPTVIVTDAVTLSVVRKLDGNADLAGPVLSGTWPGQSEPVRLASASLHA